MNNYEALHNEQPTTIHTPDIQRDLRYVLTQKCNYQCSFCHKEWCDGSEKELLTADDYDFIFSTAQKSLWIHQVSLSGGEPMMRKDLWDITQKLKKSWAKITMVSNWALMYTNPDAIGALDTLNISLHTTNQQLFTELTWSSAQIYDIISQLSSMQEKYPHLNIKLNSAIIKDQNLPGSQDFEQKVVLAEKYWRKLKYLELSDADIPGFVDLETFHAWLIDAGFTQTHTTARQWFFKRWPVEIITGRVFCSQAKQTDDAQAYCKQYNDLYVTPDGYLSACPIDIKKLSAYDAIISRNSEELSLLLQEAVDKTTNYKCPFTS